jgi:hypothetical protein
MSLRKGGEGGKGCQLNSLFCDAVGSSNETDLCLRLVEVVFNMAKRLVMVD